MQPLAYTRPSTTAAGDAASHVWSLPHPRNPEFVGRDAVLASLRKSLTQPQAPRVQVVYGVAGVGKTQFVAEYAYRHRHNYGLVWWLPANDPAALSLAFSKLASRLGLRGVEEAGAPEVRQELRRVLDAWEEWLLVFDDAPDQAAVRSFLPEPGDGHVLITSRSAAWRGVGPSFCLRSFERADSVDYLKRRAGHPKADTLAGTLAQALGDLPAALEQAAATIRQAGINFSEYLARFEEHWAELLRSGRPAGDYPDTALMSAELALRDAEDKAPEAAALLKLWSFLAPADLSKEYLRDAATALPAPLSHTAGNPATFDESMWTLARYGLIEPPAEGRAVFVPRLTAAIVRDRLGDFERNNWCEMALRMVEATYRFDNAPAAAWEALGELLPHALAVVGHGEALGVAPDAASRLLNQVGQFLYHRGQYTRAKEAFTRALNLCEAAHGPDDPRRSSIANNLGRVLKRLGDLRGARTHFRSAMAADGLAYGNDHPHVAEVANNYGVCLQMAGDVDGARQHFEWSLSVCQSHFGADHPKTAAVVNNLGYALKSSGDVDQAMELFGRALASVEAAYGANHPTVANISTNLGIALRLKGEGAAARAYFERSIAAVDGTLGPNHPELSRHLMHYGISLQEEGDLESARRHFERALRIDEKALGPVHFTLLTRLNYLGRCLKMMGLLDESAGCYAQGAEVLRQLRDAAGAADGAEVAAAQLGANAAADDAAGLFCIDDTTTAASDTSTAQVVTRP